MTSSQIKEDCGRRYLCLFISTKCQSHNTQYHKYTQIERRREKTPDCTMLILSKSHPGPGKKVQFLLNPKIGLCQIEQIHQHFTLTTKHPFNPIQSFCRLEYVWEKTESTEYFSYLTIPVIRSLRTLTCHNENLFTYYQHLALVFLFSLLIVINFNEQWVTTAYFCLSFMPRHDLSFGHELPVFFLSLGLNISFDYLP